MKKITLFISFFIIIFIPFSYSQGIYNNGANIIVSSGATVYIDGDNSGDYLTTANGKLDIKNTAEVFIEGDWTNNNGADNAITTTSTTGWVRFEGNTAGAQTVGGNFATTFPYLEFNNSNGITLNQNAITAGKLELTSGVVTTSTNRLEMTSTTSADLVTYSSTAFVYGNLRRYITSNTSTYVLPIGNGTASTNYFRADFINNNSTGINYLDASVSAISESGNNIDANVVATEDGSPYTDVKGETAEWTITPDASTSANYGINLYIANISGLADDKFGIVKRANASTDYADWDSFDATTTIPTAGSAGRTVASGYANKTGFTSFSKFAVALSTEVLPIELISFNSNCSRNKESIELNWTTASEENTSHFVIEKSVDGNIFQEIADIPANGNSSQQLNYNYTDDEIDNQNYFYRLRTIDFDGKENISNLIYQKPCINLKSTVNVFNALDNNFLLNIESQYDENFQLTMVDALGKTVLSKTGKAQKGSNQFTYNYGNIATGPYFITFIGNKGTVYSNKLIIH